MSNIKNTKREFCFQCHMLKTHCLCSHVTPQNSRINLVVLQHPQEAKHHKNTVQLLKLNIPNCQIFMGNDDDFNLSEHPEFAHLTTKNTLLLYPQTNSVELSSNSIQQDFAHSSNNSQALNLIVIDSNWKKSKKIFLTNPWLHSLKSYHLLLDGSPSIYQIRKKRQAHFRSTLEATVMALNILEDYPMKTSFELLKQFCELKKADVELFANRNQDPT
ncbi:MAG: DTW domain-containing protein [Saccharospirillaceae bacterium]|nr:DTW domain-containing protein [Pseudomonadales bacterium]NRB77535.1 DTW domain-containing protein [Saccharospirillaceae bacterium]